jgi:hypothetical protein
VEVARAVSLAQGKLGEFDAATERLSAVVELQRKLDVTGLMLGATSELANRFLEAGDARIVTGVSGQAAR